MDPKKDIIKYASIGAKGKHEERLFFEAEEVMKIKNLGMSPCERGLSLNGRSAPLITQTSTQAVGLSPEERHERAVYMQAFVLDLSKREREQHIALSRRDLKLDLPICRTMQIAYRLFRRC
jgi:hypothetical protein